MDADRFDALSRSLTRLGSRRSALATALAGGLGTLATVSTEAKKKKKCPPCKKRKKGKCKANLPDGTACSGGTCQGGSCIGSVACPAGQRPCRGACLSVLVCCDDADCPTGRTCQQGICACPPATPHVCPGSTLCQQCCVQGDCAPNSGPGYGDRVATCQAGICVCPRSDTRYCPSLRSCGVCCTDGDCPGNQTCKEQPVDPNVCGCDATQIACSAAGRTGCITATGTCDRACNAPCSEQDANPCECSSELVCAFDPNNVADGYHCAPR